jgi:chorismate mutase
MDADQSLVAVRREIDAIDDEIHDLIIRRTELVEAVRDLKKDSPVKIRPSREAEIAYRLVGRHRGHFPRRELVAMWRHMMMATLAFEGPFSVAVYSAGNDGGYWDLARDHFGTFTPLSRHGTLRSAIEAVQRQDATVAVLPTPRQDDPDPWWRLLLSDRPETPRIIARLPFGGTANGLGGAIEALAICPVALTPTGRDRTFFAVDTEYRLSLNQFNAELAAVGLPPRFAAVWEEKEQRPQAWIYLVEVDGFLSAGDPRLVALTKGLGGPVRRVVVLGGYATPLSRDELDAPAAPAAMPAMPSPAKAG